MNCTVTKVLKRDAKDIHTFYFVDFCLPLLSRIGKSATSLHMLTPRAVAIFSMLQIEMLRLPLYVFLLRLKCELSNV